MSSPNERNKIAYFLILHRRLIKKQQINPFLCSQLKNLLQVQSMYRHSLLKRAKSYQPNFPQASRSQASSSGALRNRADLHEYRDGEERYQPRNRGMRNSNSQRYQQYRNRGMRSEDEEGYWKDPDSFSTGMSSANSEARGSANCQRHKNCPDHFNRTRDNINKQRYQNYEDWNRSHDCRPNLHKYQDGDSSKRGRGRVCDDRYWNHDDINRSTRQNWEDRDHLGGRRGSENITANHPQHWEADGNNDDQPSKQCHQQTTLHIDGYIDQVPLQKCLEMIETTPDCGLKESQEYKNMANSFAARQGIDTSKLGELKENFYCNSWL